MKLELHKEYSYTYLVKWFDDYAKIDPNAEWIDNHRTGFQTEDSAIMINMAGTTYSFLKTGYNSNGDIYKLLHISK